MKVSMIFITTTKTSALELILEEMSWELLLLSKNVSDTIRQIEMKITATTIAKVA